MPNRVKDCSGNPAPGKDICSDDPNIFLLQKNITEDFQNISGRNWNGKPDPAKQGYARKNN